LEQSIFYHSTPVSLSEYLKSPNRSGIIAEFKHKSPSKGYINQYADVEETTISYMQAGASALSILTDEKFFGGSSKDLEIARKFNFCPILRKDFIVDEYQVYETKSIGADAILLIARILSPKQVADFSKIASKIGLEVLLEVHTDDEVKNYLSDDINLVGINNRNLDTFDVNIENSVRIAELIPKNITKIAESGINSIETIHRLKENGFSGFLIGEYFMRNSHPGEVCKELIKQLKS